MRWAPTPVAIGVLALTVAGLAAGLVYTQEVSRQDLRQRFDSRADLSSRFTSAYVGDVITREKANAGSRLSGATVSRAEFDQVVAIMGLEAAVLLDDKGRVLQVVPDNPAVVGKLIATRYPHLTAAEAGRTAVSAVVPGASSGRPIVGFAVPFSTPSGRRVFSGGFDVGSSPLGTYLLDSLPYPGATADLVDPTGKLVATSRTGAPRTLGAVDPGLARSVASAEGTIGRSSAPRRFVTEHPSGTPWTLVNTVPESALYSPLSSPGQWIQWAALIAFLAAGVYVVVLVVRLGHSREALARTSSIDALTGLANRRTFDVALQQELARTSRTGLRLCVAMLDLDHFKRFNDTHGHPAGDALLSDAASRWRAQVRDVDILARYGGEEFVLLMPGCSLEDAPLVVSRLQTATPSATTVSIGVAEWDRSESTSALMSRADTALYSAKGQGRNIVVVDSGPQPAMGSGLVAG